MPYNLTGEKTPNTQQVFNKMCRERVKASETQGPLYFKGEIKTRP